jgi:hypothetical protein
MWMRMSKILIVKTLIGLSQLSFENEFYRDQYVDRVILPQHKFALLPPVVIKVDDVMFVGDDHPNDGDLK